MMSLQEEILDYGRRARLAARSLAQLSAAQKNAALLAMAWATQRLPNHSVIGRAGLIAAVGYFFGLCLWKTRQPDTLVARSAPPEPSLAS